MSSWARKFLLTAHVVVSVGWLGAVLVLLVLGVLAVVSQDQGTVRAVFIVMAPAAELVLVPLALAALVTGLVQSVVTQWGVLRHYWVVFKLVINLAAVIVLVAYLRTLAGLAALAREPATSPGDFAGMRSSPAIHAALALVLLLVATVLAVYKPKGLTRYGRRRQRSEQTQQA